MARRLFKGDPPEDDNGILYPGCGTAPFGVAVETICKEENWPLPEGHALDRDPELLSEARKRELRHVDIERRDFLGGDMAEVGRYQYVLGNPPYVPIEGLSEEEKARYKTNFRTATGRFDLYLLFFERALDLLAPGGRLTFVTPEKWEYVDTARPLRRLLTGEKYHVEEIHHIDEDAFPGRITFPSVTTIRHIEGSPELSTETDVILRDGTRHRTNLPMDGQSWAATVRGADLSDMNTGITLGDVARRVSPGMATGADAEFVYAEDEVPDALVPDWVRPTVSGRELGSNGVSKIESVLVCPYRDDGTLVEESNLGAFGEWARARRERLENRSCVQKAGKKWYAWHETPPMDDLLQPKVVFKDIEKEPRFWAERSGDVVPRHSVYYIVPGDGVSLDDLLDYLNSPLAQKWMEANCQRAANGFLRLQSRVLKKLPVPREIAQSYQAALAL